jgi:hypothetical protein
MFRATIVAAVTGDAGADGADGAGVAAAEPHAAAATAHEATNRARRGFMARKDGGS